MFFAAAICILKKMVQFLTKSCRKYAVCNTDRLVYKSTSHFLEIRLKVLKVLRINKICTLSTLTLR